jgi:hypothetical protein
MSQESFSSKIECICSRKCIHRIKILALQAKIFQFLSQKIVYQKSREAATLGFNAPTIINLCEAKKIWWDEDLEGVKSPSKSIIRPRRHRISLYRSCLSCMILLSCFFLINKRLGEKHEFGPSRRLHCQLSLVSFLTL